MRKDLTSTWHPSQRCSPGFPLRRRHVHFASLVISPSTASACAPRTVMPRFASLITPPLALRSHCAFEPSALRSTSPGVLAHRSGHGFIASIGARCVAARRRRHGTGPGLASAGRSARQPRRAPRLHCRSPWHRWRPAVACCHRCHLLVGIEQNPVENKFLDRTSGALPRASAPWSLVSCLEGRHWRMDRLHCSGDSSLLRPEVPRPYPR